GAVRQADRRRCAADFLHRDDMFEITEPGPAELLFDGDAKKAQFAELRPEIPREAVRLVDLRRLRLDVVACEAAQGLPQHLDVVTEPKIEFDHDWFLFRIFRTAANA